MAGVWLIICAVWRDGSVEARGGCVQMALLVMRGLLTLSQGQQAFERL